MQYTATVKYPGKNSPFTYNFFRDSDKDAKEEIKHTIGKGVFVKLQKHEANGTLTTVH